MLSIGLPASNFSSVLRIFSRAPLLFSNHARSRFIPESGTGPARPRCCEGTGNRHRRRDAARYARPVSPRDGVAAGRCRPFPKDLLPPADHRRGLLLAQRFFSASDLARIFASVVTGVIASGSMASRMMAGLPDACASLNAAGKSAVRSTLTPKPPKARA